MTQVDVNQDGFVVDASLIAAAFEIAPEDVQSLMRSGEITSKCETGVDEDAGRSRLTFYFGGRAIRLVVDPAGTILKQTRFSVKTRTPAPTDMLPMPTSNATKTTS